MGALNDPLRGLHIFVVAAQAENFTQAGERIGLTKSAIGKAVGKLEERLGVRLFHRNSRISSLTDEGRQLHDQCQRVFEELRVTEAMLTGQTVDPVGQLRIDLPEMLGRDRIMPILLDTMARYPRLTLNVSFSNRRIDLVEEGIDLTVRLGELEDSTTLAFRPIGQQQTILCAAPDYLARAGTPDTLASLAAHEAVIEVRNKRPLPWRLREAGNEWQSLRPSGRLMLNEASSVLQAALRGFGVALVPAWAAAEHVAAGRLVRLLPEMETPVLQVSALWPRSRWLSTRHRVVIDALRAQLRGADRDIGMPITSGAGE